MFIFLLMGLRLQQAILLQWDTQLGPRIIRVLNTCKTARVTAEEQCVVLSCILTAASTVTVRTPH